MFYYFNTPAQIAADSARQNKEYLTALSHYEQAADALNSSITAFTKHGTHTPYMLTYVIHEMIQTRCELLQAQQGDNAGFNFFLSHKQKVLEDFARAKKYADEYLNEGQKAEWLTWCETSHVSFLISCIDAYWSRVLYLTKPVELPESQIEEAINHSQRCMDLINELKQLKKNDKTDLYYEVLSLKNTLTTRLNFMPAKQEAASTSSQTGFLRERTAINGTLMKGIVSLQDCIIKYHESILWRESPN